MSEDIIVTTTPPPPFNYSKKMLELVLKGAAIGGALSYLIATKKYNIRKFIDVRKRLISQRLLSHTNYEAILGAGKGAGLSLIWYALYYHILDVPKHTRDELRTMIAYTVMGSLTAGLLFNSAVSYVGMYMGFLLGGASVLKDIGRKWVPLGEQIQYKEVDEEQRKRTLAEYNLRILGNQRYLQLPDYKLPQM